MTSHLGRVLVVDDDPHFCDSAQVLLTAIGYTVFTAHSVYEGRQIAREERVHVAVLDVRMSDNPNRDDVSGLELAKELDPLIVKIMLTGFPDPHMIRSAFLEAAAFTFVTKDECPDGLLDELSRAFTEVVRINFDLRIDWQDIGLEAVAHAVEVKEGASPAVMAAELEELLRKLFYPAEEIRIAALIPPGSARSTSQSGAVLLKVQPRYRGSGAWGEPVVVKIAARDKIVTETRNYHRYVEGYMAGHRHTRLHQREETHLLGGILYMLVGSPIDDCMDLGSFYVQHSADEVVQVLKRLFIDTCSRWYTNRTSRQNQDLRQLYARALKLSVGKLETVLQELDIGEGVDSQVRRVRPPGFKARIPSPVDWLRRHPDLPAELSQCYTHGDLHSRNVLVDNTGQAWLIDFYRTGLGHLFRDLIELECDVKFVLLGVTDLPSLLRFEVALLKASEFGDIPTLPRFEEPELRKAFVVVLGIRRIASQLADPGADMLDYYQGLVLQTLTMIRLRHVLPPQKRHAYLAASLLCQRLDEWQKPM
jgi:DNA-binding response OmpR family regulator